ncbi:TPA: helix-turn-helix domain-containing protein [Yersinia enterocolitica]|uniref:helix-turn-helix domain-containing protein n=1 Tax=Yersinia enterocolitica TaxID=630 RepID=UPI0028B6E34A|nr:helix-turn-helix transcriptional regulator [Yersinia enterocolitica]ELI8444497.1 helix-turn-helix transcriptional regulator [Yersinia enterocolitica]ELY5259736.1 helix-turn-helix transcriptional regulator [Yersinia enterocolitica]
MNKPAAVDIKKYREAKGLTQTEAAQLIFSKYRTWQDWESGKASMHPGLWELFLLKTGQKIMMEDTSIFQGIIEFEAPNGCTYRYSKIDNAISELKNGAYIIIGTMPLINHVNPQTIWDFISNNGQ